MPITSRVRCEVQVRGIWVQVAECSSNEPNVILGVLERFELRVHKERARCWFRPNADDTDQPELEVEWLDGKGPCITYTDPDDRERKVTQSIRDFMVHGI